MERKHRAGGGGCAPSSPSPAEEAAFPGEAGKAEVGLFLFDFAVYRLTFCTSLSVYNKPGLAGELPSLLLPSILAGAVLGHVLLVSGSCALKNTRWHLGTVPSHPYWPVLVLFQSSGNAGGTEASADPFPSRLWS